MPMSNEIKPSFTIKHFALLIITAIISGGTGYFFKYLFESPDDKIISVNKVVTENLIQSVNEFKNQIKAEYSIIGNENIEIKSYFRQSIQIRNEGGEGIENLEIIFDTNNPEINLLTPPSINTIPKEVKKSLKFTLSKDSVSSSHSWIVDLVNPSETIIFEYSAYSSTLVEILDIEVIPRKKDWNVIYNPGLSTSSKNDFWLISIFIALIFLLIGLFGIEKTVKLLFNINPIPYEFESRFKDLKKSIQKIKKETDLIIFYDNFDDFEGWTQFKDGKIEQTSEVSRNGQYSLKKSGPGDPNGGYKDLNTLINKNLVFSGIIYSPETRKGGKADRLSILDENFNGYGFSVVANENSFWIEKRTNGNATTISQKIEFSMPNNRWYKFEFSWLKTGDCILDLYDLSDNLLGSVESTDLEKSYASFNRIGIHGGSEYFVDEISIAT